MRSRRKTTHETAREEGSRPAAASENPRCASIPRKSGSAQVAGRSRDLSLSGGCRKCSPAPQRSVPTFRYGGCQRNAPLQVSCSPQRALQPKASPSKSQPAYPNPASEEHGLHETGHALQVSSGESKATPIRPGETDESPVACRAALRQALIDNNTGHVNIV